MRILLALLVIGIFAGGAWWLWLKPAPENEANTAQAIHEYLATFPTETLSINRVMRDPNDAQKLILQGLKIDYLWSDLNWRAFYSTIKRPSGVNTISIPDARLSLYHPSTGLLNFNIAAQIRFSADDRFTLSAKTISEQTKLSLEATLTGQGIWPQSNTWSGEFEMQIAQTNLNLINLQLNRISGAIDVTVSSEGNIALTPDLKAGGLNVFGLPWKDVTIKEQEMKAQALHTGADPLTLFASPNNITIKANTLGNFLDYLERYGAQLKQHQRARTYETLANITVDLQAANASFAEAITQDKALTEMDIVFGKESVKTRVNDVILLPH